MSGKENKTLIGAFVVGAIAILVLALLVLGSGKFFTKSQMYILFFEGSVKGLNVGSPVVFRGVKIGEVSDIRVAIDQFHHALRIPVIIELQPERIEGGSLLRRDEQAMKRAVERGLRAQLQLQNFVTGQLMVALDFFPKKPAQYVDKDKDYTEIPTVPTEFQELQRTVEHLPLREMVVSLNSAVQGIDKIVNTIDTRKTTQTLEAAIRDIQTLVRHVDDRIDPLVAGLSRATSATEATMEESRETAAAARENMKDLAAAMKTTLETAQASLKQSELTLSAYSEDSPLVTELNKTLRELGATSRSLRQLSDYLERHPESLLRGKAVLKGQ